MKFLAVLGLLYSFTVYGMTLETPRYLIVVEQKCPEGNVTCSNVTYVGTNKSTGDSISLVGSTMHTYASDGTPNQFLGYRFENGNITYMVTVDGRLTVTRNGNEVLLEELGDWEY